MRRRTCRHAVGRDAPRLAQLFVTLLLSCAAVDIGDTVRDAPGTPMPSATIAALSTWVRHIGRLCHHRSGRRRLIAWLEELLNRGPRTQLQIRSCNFGCQVLQRLLEYCSFTAPSSWSATSWIPENGWPFKQTESARLNEQLSKAQLNALSATNRATLSFQYTQCHCWTAARERNDAAVSMRIAK